MYLSNKNAFIYLIIRSLCISCIKTSRIRYYEINTQILPKKRQNFLIPAYKLQEKIILISTKTSGSEFVSLNLIVHVHISSCHDHAYQMCNLAKLSLTALPVMDGVVLYN